MEDNQISKLIDTAKKEYKLEFNSFPLSKEDYKQFFLFHAYRAMSKRPIQLKYEINNIIKTVLLYFFNDTEFNKYGVVVNNASLAKGILLIGDNGVGKSMLFEILSEMGKELVRCANYGAMSFREISAINFVMEFMKSAKSHREATKAFELSDYYQNAIFIDDLGREEKAFSRHELLGTLLFERHRRQSKTYATTNKTLEELTQRYDEHIGDRIPEMFNIIYWRGDSYRD
nr:AAA family ATPase [uncultured Allomuricauda sp.]